MVLFRSMVRHLRIYRAFLRNCLRQAVEFRTNFWANLFTNFGWIAMLTLFLKLIFSNTQSVAGWTEGSMFMLVGTYSLVRSIADTLFGNNLSDLPNQIRLGTMDFTLLRPVNSQFFVSLRFIALDNLGQLVGAAALLAYGAGHHHGGFTSLGLASYAVLVACAVVIFYSLSLLSMTLAFWFVRVENLFVALETVASLSRTPIEVFRAFGPAAPFFLTYVLPLAFLAAMPVKALFRDVQASAVVSGVVLSSTLFVLASLFWRRAIRSYSSASS